jgi:hypothetical protein
MGKKREGQAHDDSKMKRKTDRQTHIDSKVNKKTDGQIHTERKIAEKQRAKKTNGQKDRQRDGQSDG